MTNKYIPLPYEVPLLDIVTFMEQVKSQADLKDYLEALVDLAHRRHPEWNDRKCRQVAYDNLSYCLDSRKSVRKWLTALRPEDYSIPFE